MAGGNGDNVRVAMNGAQTVVFQKEFDRAESRIKTIRENYFDGPKEVITETAGLDDEPIEIDDEDDFDDEGFRTDWS